MGYKTAAEFVKEKGFVVGDKLHASYMCREWVEILYIGNTLVVVKDQDGHENAYYHMDSGLEKL